MYEKAIHMTYNTQQNVVSRLRLRMQKNKQQTWSLHIYKKCLHSCSVVLFKRAILKLFLPKKNYIPHVECILRQSLNKHQIFSLRNVWEISSTNKLLLNNFLICFLLVFSLLPRKHFKIFVSNNSFYFYYAYILDITLFFFQFTIVILGSKMPITIIVIVTTSNTQINNKTFNNN